MSSLDAPFGERATSGALHVEKKGPSIGLAVESDHLRYSRPGAAPRRYQTACEGQGPQLPRREGRARLPCVLCELRRIPKVHGLPDKRSRAGKCKEAQLNTMNRGHPDATSQKESTASLRLLALSPTAAHPANMWWACASRLYHCTNIRHKARGPEN